MNIHAEARSKQDAQEVVFVRYDAFTKRKLEPRFHGEDLSSPSASHARQRLGGAHVKTLYNEDRYVKDRLCLRERVHLVRAADRASFVVNESRALIGEVGWSCQFMRDNEAVCRTRVGLLGGPTQVAWREPFHKKHDEVADEAGQIQYCPSAFTQRATDLARNSIIPASRYA